MLRNILHPRPTGTWKSVDVGQPKGVDVIELKNVPLGPDGRIGALPFEVPADAQSLVVTATGKPGTWYRVSELVDPRGALLHSDVAQDLELGTDTARVIWERQFAGAMVPNSTVDHVLPGTWTAQVIGQEDSGAAARGTVDVRIIIKRGEAVPKRGHLDVHLHFGSERGLDAAHAKTDAQFQRALEEFREVYATAGIDLDFTYDDTPRGFGEVDFGEKEGVPDVQDLYRATSDGLGMHLFVVDSFGAQNKGLGGKSAGIPGNPLGGSEASGVVARWSRTAEEFLGPGIPPEIRTKVLEQMAEQGLDTPEAIAAMQGHTMAHEVAHFLGLFHTYENARGTYGVNTRQEDALDSTSRKDRGNVMTPTLTANPLTMWTGFTEEQGEKLRQSPLVET